MDPLYHTQFPNLYLTVPLLLMALTFRIYTNSQISFTILQDKWRIQLHFGPIYMEIAPHWFSSKNNELNSSELYCIFPTVYNALNLYFIRAFTWQYVTLWKNRQGSWDCKIISMLKWQLYMFLTYSFTDILFSSSTALSKASNYWRPIHKNIPK